MTNSRDDESPEQQGLTYRDAGVDIDAGNELVNAIKPLIKSTHRPGVLGNIGGFGGLFDLKQTGLKDPLLVAANDGVGTKLKIAIDTGIHHTVGIDLTAMCVNDLIVQGAEPLFFLDYFACGKLENGVAEAVIKGIAEGCAIAGCALIGGETAEMPGMYEEGDYDLAGFSVGAVERGALLPKSTISEGNQIIALASNGVHSNGFSLVRKILEHAKLSLDDKTPFDSDKTIGETLLTPTRIYVRPILKALKEIGGINALAHITGGGLVENIPRILSNNLSASVDLARISPSPVFGWLKQLGNISEAEMIRTFNCGVGMVIIAEAEKAEQLISLFNREGETATLIGEIIKADTPLPVKKSVELCLMTERRKVGILISGRGSNMEALINAANAPDYPAEIVLVISNNPGAKGLDIAKASNINTKIISHKDYQTREEFDQKITHALEEAGVELLCNAGFMRLHSQKFVETWFNRQLNIHPSLLPALKGLNSHQRALDGNLKITGCTVHFVRFEMDTGPIIAQAAVEIHPDDTVETLSVRVLQAEHQLYPEALRQVASGKAKIVGERLIQTGSDKQQAPLFSPPLTK